MARHTHRIWSSLALALVALMTPGVLAWAGEDETAPSDWYGSVAERVRAAEYRFSDLGSGDSFSAPNRAHGLRTRVDRTGVQIVPRTTRQGSAASEWELRLRLTGVGRRGSMSPVGLDAPAAVAERVELLHGAVREWYLNDEKGLEQGFVIEQPPAAGAGSSPLILEMTIDGLRAIPSEDGRSVQLFASGSVPVLRYGGLEVTDAAGQRVAARLALAPGRLRILVEDEQAVYPIDVDPLFSDPAWTARDAAVIQTGANLGESSATAGDVNGDGYSDVIVGAAFFDNGQIDEGAVFVYLGSAAGVSSTYAWKAESDQAGASLGKAAASAGDVNGDGYDDVIVGAPMYDNGQADEGRAFLWLGGPSGLGANGTPTNADWSAESDQVGAEFGARVAAAGDVNGNGKADVLVSAPKYDNGLTDEGRVYVYLGVAGGLAVLPAWTAESNQASARLGDAVGSAGDVNADGYSDILIASPRYDNPEADEGAVFLWYGASSFGSGADGTPANAAWMAQGDQLNANLGYSVGTAGDVNGDGYSDVIVGAYLYDNGQGNEGAAFVWLGGATGPGATGTPFNADWFKEGQLANVFFGSSVGTAGDVNGDGFADVIVSSTTYTLDHGQAWVWEGGPTGLGPTGGISGFDWSVASTDAFSAYGFMVGTAGDVDGDGFSDVIVGEPFYSGSDAGRALVYHGLAGGLAASPMWSAQGGLTLAAFGASVASAGDVNGDGYGDLIVGAPGYDNGQRGEGRVSLFLGTIDGPSSTPSWNFESNLVDAKLGSSVAAAGDVNGDGYGDVIVGMPGYGSGQPGEGRALLFNGSATGLSPSFNWATESNVSSAQLGSSVAGAGDVNGDGYADVVVGAPLYTRDQFNEGFAELFFGGPAGLGALPSWTAEGNAASARFGCSVASAGDVNADHFSDVIVGSSTFSGGALQGGIARVYVGSGSGLSANPAWTAEADQASAAFGAAVASAGDVDGDGYSDVIVGAPNYSNGSSFEGAAFLWLGGASFGSAGVETPAGAAWHAESEQASAHLGTSVASAGDVDGDGYSDIIVGAERFSNGEASEGGAFVWLGSATGPVADGTPANDDWTAESNVANSLFGSSVAPAGDVNGDGFGDVVIGAIQYSGGLSSQGGAYCYLGNQGDGLHRAVRQVRRDDTVLVGPLGRSDHETEFRLRIWGRTPLGRGDVRMQAEVKPLGTPFDGTGLTTSPPLDSGFPFAPYGSAVALDNAVIGLAPATFYHWRVRLLTDSPSFPRSPWFSHPYNNRTETDIRTAGCLDTDGDGFGAPADAACAGGPSLDCNDGSAAISPAAAEVCDNLDNDCDGRVDTFVTSCGVGPCARSGFCAAGVDSCVPGAPSAEVCDGLDNDCNGSVPASEADGDNDGVRGCAGDCNDADATILKVPGDIDDLEAHLLPPSGNLFSWTSLAPVAGSGTVYDVFSGLIWGGGPAGDFSTGRCLSENQTSASLNTSTIAPDPGQVFYFLVRGQNACPAGTGTYGTLNEDTTAAASPGACL